MDVFRRAQRIDEKGVNKNDPFFIDYLNDIARVSNSANEKLASDNIEHIFNSDIDKFNNECLEFINYVKECVNDSNNDYYLYLTRSGNDIEYGKFDLGIREKKKAFRMVSESDLENIYDLIKTEFESQMIERNKHTSGFGWSLIPIISDNVVLEVESVYPYDSEWIYDVVHREKKDSKRA